MHQFLLFTRFARTASGKLPQPPGTLSPVDQPLDEQPKSSRYGEPSPQIDGRRTEPGSTGHGARRVFGGLPRKFPDSWQRQRNHAFALGRNDAHHSGLRDVQLQRVVPDRERHGKAGRLYNAYMLARLDAIDSDGGSADSGRGEFRGAKAVGLEP